MTDEQTADAGETQAPDRAYPSPEDQAYAPAGRAHDPADPGYPPPGQAYPAGDQGSLPADQAYPPGDQGYLPADQAYPAGDQSVDQGESPADRAYPPGDQGYLPADQAYPAGDQSVDRGESPADRAYPPGGQGSPPEATRAPDELPQPAETDRQWSEILAMFVDDPRASVKLAARLLDQAVEDLVVTVRQRQASLASAWQDSDAGTEVLRGSLRDYRAFWAVVQGMPAAGATPPRSDSTGPRSGATGPRSDSTSRSPDTTRPGHGMSPDAAGAAGPDEPGRNGMPA